jgi:hypothetical protein
MGVDVRCAVEEEGVKCVEEQKKAGRPRCHQCRRGSSPIRTQGASDTSRGGSATRVSVRTRRGGYDGGCGGAACRRKEKGLEEKIR